MEEGANVFLGGKDRVYAMLVGLAYSPYFKSSPSAQDFIRNEFS